MSDFLRHWNYFLLLEKEFIETKDFVEPERAQFHVYSTRFTRLFLSSCAELEAVFKVLCFEIDPTAKPETITQYESILHGRFPKFNENKFDYMTLEMKPFDGWTNETSPMWWKLHQKLKHSRNENFHEGNLGNALDALSGLYIALLHLQRLKNIRDGLPTPQEFYFPGCAACIGTGNTPQLADFQ